MPGIQLEDLTDINNDYIDATKLSNGIISVVVIKTEKMQNATSATIKLKCTVTDKFGDTRSFPFTVQIAAKKLTAVKRF